MEKRKERNMESVRKRFEGVANIVRFNWHFYLIAVLVITGICILGIFLHGFLQLIAFMLGGIILATIMVSLVTSFYIYDLSNLYKLNWVPINLPQTILNVHAGFDETSKLIQTKFPQAQLQVFDFYDPKKHTEVSIKRARRVYPSFPGTVSITTNQIPVSSNTIDLIFLTLAAHEIRNDTERDIFFKEAARVLKPGGKIIVTEHLRDFPNFLVYNIGFMHFLSKKTWEKNFVAAGLEVTQEIKITPFITSFILHNSQLAGESMNSIKYKH